MKLCPNQYKYNSIPLFQLFLFLFQVRKWNSIFEPANSRGAAFLAYRVSANSSLYRKFFLWLYFIGHCLQLSPTVHAVIYLSLFCADTLYLIIIVVTALCILSRSAGCYGVGCIVWDSDVVLCSDRHECGTCMCIISQFIFMRWKWL